MPDDTPLEPWPDYATLSREARLSAFKAKEEEARLRWDKAYALALSSAVGNYERMQQLAEHPDHDDQVHGAARALHDNAGSWQHN